MARQSIQVKHNIEVAHRLSLLPGPCQHIHGHSMQVHLEMYGKVDSRGILDGMDFSAVKRAFRSYLDENYDHHLILNEDDPLVSSDRFTSELYPGLHTFPGDPTTENIAKWVGQWARDTFTPFYGLQTIVWETGVNCASWRSVG